MTSRFIFLLAAAGIALHATAATAPVPDKQSLGKALARYLAERGQLCVGKYDWPITVAPQAAENGDRNARQLPVMEQAGLVTGSPDETGAITYRLSDAGMKYYWPRKVNRRDGGQGEMDVHDFCAGRLALDQVVHWTAPALVGDHYESTATYTYSIVSAEWTTDPRLQQAFPMIARVIAGQHKARLAQRMRYAGGRWEAVTTVE